MPLRMKESTKLSEADRRLISALQMAPRASWLAIGEALDMSAVTAARRWQRLQNDGIAWVTAAPGIALRSTQCIAYVELNCAPAHRSEVASILASHPQVATVELTTGTADMMLTVVAADFRRMSDYLLERLGTVPHVTATRARVATELFSEASSWRLTELEDRARERLEAATAPERADKRNRAFVHMTDDLRQVARALAADGRASLADIAAEARMSAPTVRRHITVLLESGTVRPRTDIAAAVAGWPVQVYLWADAPAAALASAARTLASLRQVRLCATVSAAPSIILAAWLQSFEEVHRLELTVAQVLPEVRIADRLVVLRTVKRMGRLTDAHGRAIGVVPIDLWESSPTT